MSAETDLTDATRRMMAEREIIRKAAQQLRTEGEGTSGAQGAQA